MFDWPIVHIIRKEFLQLKRDPLRLYLVMVVPIFQILVFGYVASTDIKNIKTTIYDLDKTKESRAYANTFSSSKYFIIGKSANSEPQIIEFLDSGDTIVAVKIPKDFGGDLKHLKETSVQCLIDGTNSASASIIHSYAEQINTQYMLNVFANMKPIGYKIKPLDLRLRIFYNPELKTSYFLIPAILAMILTITSMILTAFAIVKEREDGTIEQLIVTPLKNWELIAGKIIPYILLAFADLLIVTGVGTLWFRVPIHGNFLLLLALSTAFLLPSLGLGIFISTISNNKQQAMMTSVFILIPSIILSGFLFPIENMPKIIQLTTYLIPVKYYLIIIRGIFSKGIGFEYLWKETLSLLIFGVIVFSLSISRFKKKLG